jgi:amidase
MSGFAEYERYDATGLAELVRRGAVTPLELVEAAIAQIDAVNPRVNAVVRTLYDQARAAATAKLPDGPLRGVPFLLKDILAAYAGIPLTSGSRFYGDWAPSQNSYLVDRFLATGMIVVGKTNTPELALLPVTEPERFGATRNPWNLGLTCGGSSGGSAAAVAARMVPIASGGDGGGSLRTPSSCCGVFGFKPSRGRVPTGPSEGEVWEGFSVEHVITRSVRDSAAILDATAGPAPGELYPLPKPTSSFVSAVAKPPRRLKIALTTQSPLANAIHADCVAAAEDAAKLLTELGHEVVEAKLELDAAEWKRTISIMMAGICAADVRDAEARLGKKAGRHDWERATWLSRAIGESFTAGEYAAAVRAQFRFGRQVAAFVASYDVWLTPTLGTPPIEIGALQSRGPLRHQIEKAIATLQLGALAKRSKDFTALVDRVFEFMSFTMLVNGPGLPSMSVPLFWNAAEIPIGIMLSGQLGDEATLFQLAGQLERARPWANRKPQAVFAKPV